MKQIPFWMATTATVSAGMCLSACGAGGGGGETLSGTYLPQFEAGANRLDMALTDQSWTFADDGTVITQSAGGARQWTYKVSGKQVRLSGASDRNSGERRTLTKGDDGCLWDGSGNLAGKMEFCPT